MGNCYFCDTVLQSEELIPNTTIFKCKCLYCGKYSISDKVQQVQQVQSIINKDSKHIILGYLYATKDRQEPLMISSEFDSNKILNDPIVPKTSMGKLEHLLINLYQFNKYIGFKFDLYNDLNERMAYAMDKGELRGMIEAMIELNWVIEDDDLTTFRFRLSTSGLNHAEQLISTNIDSKKVFVAMGFDKELMEALQEAIKPACAECGFEADIVSSTHNNDITDKIIAEIKTSKFVIVDFTNNNHGAYYEAGYARGRGLEVIHCCNKEWFDKQKKGTNKTKKIHFDIEHINIIIWKDHTDYKEKLIDNIKANIL